MSDAANVYAVAETEPEIVSLAKWIRSNHTITSRLSYRTYIVFNRGSKLSNFQNLDVNANVVWNRVFRKSVKHTHALFYKSFVHIMWYKTKILP